MGKDYRGKKYLEATSLPITRRYNMSDSEELVPAYTTESNPRETAWRPGESDSKDTSFTGTRLDTPYDDEDATLFADMEEHDEAKDAAEGATRALNTSDSDDLSLEGRRRAAVEQAMRKHGYLPESSN